MGIFLLVRKGFARYNYDQAKENRTLFNDLMYGDYYRAKSELKSVEKKYNK